MNSIEGNPKIPHLKNYKDEQLKEKLKSLMEMQNDQNYISEKLLGIGMSSSNVLEFLNGQTCSNLNVAFFLSYIYNFDLLNPNPLLPYFIIGYYANKEYYLDEVNNSILKNRRRKVDHPNIIIMISMDAKWFSAIYSLTDNSLFIIDLQFTSLSKDKLKEHTDKFYALSKIHFAYKPKKVNYITDKIPSKTDGAELYINFLFNYITGQTLSKIKFSSDEKKYFRRKLVWAAILMHEIEDEEEKQDDPPLKSQKSFQSENRTPQKNILLSKPSSELSMISKDSKSKIPEEEKKEQKSIAKFGLKKKEDRKKSEEPNEEKPKKNRFALFGRKKDTEDRNKSEESKKGDDQSRKSNLKPILKERSVAQSRQNTLLSIPQDNSKKSRIQSKSSQSSKHNDSNEMNDFEEFDKSFSRKGGSKQSYKQPTPQNNIYQQLLTPIKDDELDILDKVKNNMELYLNQLESDPLTKKHDALKLLEIDRLNDRIQDKLQNKKQDSIDDLLKDMNLLNKYNPVINQSNVQQMLSDLLDYDDYSDNLNQSLLKREKYVKKKLSTISKRQNADVTSSLIFQNIDSLPYDPKDNIVLSKPMTQSDLVQQSQTVAYRYGIRLEVNLMQQFLQDRKVPQLLMNFMLHFLQEKFDYLKMMSFGYDYRTHIKIFPLEFYLILSFYNIYSSSNINYLEASKYTIQYSGMGQTIFDVYDWLIIPVMELPNEYSLVVVDIKKNFITLFQLSSTALRIHDPIYTSALKNPFIKNVDHYLRREWSYKVRVKQMEKFEYQFGMVNRSKEFAYKMRFEDSGLHLISIIIYLGQKNTLDDLCVQESTKILAKAFYDICVKIGYHDKDIGYVLAENKWPF